MTLAFLGQLGDAIEFIFHKTEGPGGAQVGGGLCVVMAVALDGILLLAERLLTPWTRARTA